MISGLFVINALTGHGRWWFVWPAIGWGIGLTIHALSTFGMIGLLGRDWEERRLKELMEEEQRRRVLIERLACSWRALPRGLNRIPTSALFDGAG